MNPYQNLLERLQAAQSDEERAWITLQFNLDTQSKAVHTAVQAAAVLHWFDREMLVYVLETPLAEAEFSALVALPYVEIFPGRGWNVHEKTRDLLRDKLWREDRARYRKFSRRAAACCRKRNTTDPVWQTEAAYHALLAEERKAEQTFIDLGIELHNHFQFAALETMLRPVLNAVRVGRLSNRVAAWVKYRQARLDYMYSRNFDTNVVLLQELAVDSGDRLLAANCIQALGDLYLSLSEFPKAHERYLEALSIYRSNSNRADEANCIQGLGNVHLRLLELPQARKRFLEAMRIYRDIKQRVGEANCIQGLGDVHEALFELPQAQERYLEALRTYRDIGEHVGEANCIQSLGDVHAELSELPQARQRYQEALLIYRSIGERIGEYNCISSMGLVAGDEGKLDEAQVYFADALQRARELALVAQEAGCYSKIGHVFTINQRYSEAISAYGKAIELSPDEAYYANRAEPHMHLGDLSAAQQDLEAAAALNQNYYYLHFNRGRLALWQGQAQASLEHLERALAQQPERGEFRLWQALALALNGAAWEEVLQAGLVRTHLSRQIREAADAADKLAQTYGAAPLEGLRGVLRTDLEARTLPSGEPSVS